ncbi:MAG: dUTP diphosphatase [Acidimicrobiales bacterium]
MLRVPLVSLEPDLGLPRYALPGDAGVDLVARVGVLVAAGGGRALVPTGVRVAIPDGYAGLVLPRSGLALRHGLTIANSPGLIDSGYRDELCAIVVNTDPDHSYEIRRGDRVAQLVVVPVAQVEWDVVAELDPSARMYGRFGHTGN